MLKDCVIEKMSFICSGFTLIELQIYLAVIAVLALMVCQVALTYHHMYDEIALSAQHNVALLAAVFRVNESFDYVVIHNKKDVQGAPGSFLKKNKLIGTLHGGQQVILDGVNGFDTHIDTSNDTIMGASFACDYNNKRATWYRAALTKAFSCSSSL